MLATVTTTNYADSGLTGSTTYSYRVRAFDLALPTANESALSVAVSETTLAAPDTTAPTVPANVTAAAQSSTQILISWSASTDTESGVGGYRIYRDGSASPLATMTSTSYTDIGLTPTTAYSYRVLAFDQAAPTANVSALSAAASATTPQAPDITAPTVPGNVTATALSTSQIQISWSASTDTESGVGGYRIYRDGSASPLATVATTSYTDTGLTASTAYNYRVLAFDLATPANASALSAAASATTQTPPDTTAPTVPANVTATALSASQIQISWSASTDSESGVGGYRIYRDGSATVLASTTATSYTDIGLTASTAYSYQVRAFDLATPTANESALSAAASATTQAPPDTTAPSVPAGVAATAQSTSQIQISWSASTDTESGVGGYRIYRDGSATVLATTTSTSYTDTGLTASTTYNYRVRAFDLATPTANESALSAAASATTETPPDTTAPTVPTGVTATAQSTSRDPDLLVGLHRCRVRRRWLPYLPRRQRHRARHDNHDQLHGHRTDGEHCLQLPRARFRPGDADRERVGAVGRGFRDHAGGAGYDRAHGTRQCLGDGVVTLGGPDLLVGFHRCGIRCRWLSHLPRRQRLAAGHGHHHQLCRQRTGGQHHLQLPGARLRPGDPDRERIGTVDRSIRHHAGGAAPGFRPRCASQQLHLRGGSAAVAECGVHLPAGLQRDFAGRSRRHDPGAGRQLALVRAAAGRHRQEVQQRGESAGGHQLRRPDFEGYLLRRTRVVRHGVPSRLPHRSARVCLLHDQLGQTACPSSEPPTVGSRSIRTAKTSCSTSPIRKRTTTAATSPSVPTAISTSASVTAAAATISTAPIGNGQRLTILLGKMLRIDVGPFNATPQPYTIPAGNPFAGNARCNSNGTGSASCPEIFAYGFRNPWRWSFDRGTGELWVGDVGEGDWEEINRVTVGGNYGWRCREGAHNTGLGCGSTGPFIDPVAEYVAPPRGRSPAVSCIAARHSRLSTAAMCSAISSPAMAVGHRAHTTPTLMLDAGDGVELLRKCLFCAKTRPANCISFDYGGATSTRSCRAAVAAALLPRCSRRLAAPTHPTRRQPASGTDSVRAERAVLVRRRGEDALAGAARTAQRIDHRRQQRFRLSRTAACW